MVNEKLIERERIAKILGADEASNNRELAMKLAFSSDLSAEAAINTLRAAAGRGRGDDFHRAMEIVGNPDLGWDTDDSDATDEEKGFMAGARAAAAITGTEFYRGAKNDGS